MLVDNCVGKIQRNYDHIMFDLMYSCDVLISKTNNCINLHAARLVESNPLPE